jgi:hypothetical protein
MEGERLAISVDRRLLPAADVLRLDYEPDPRRSTHCLLVPERYEDLETRLVEARFRADKDYSGYSLSIPYVQLDADFEWLTTSSEE